MMAQVRLATNLCCILAPDGAVGGALSLVGGGSFVANLAYGALEGALTGGLNAIVWNQDVGKGMLTGAAWGAAFAGISSGIESIKNANDGYGFGTNQGRLNRMVSDYKSAAGTTDEMLKANKAIGLVQKKYGLDGVSINYNASTNAYGETFLNDGNINIGSSAFESSSMLKATIIHEYGHSTIDRVFSNGSWSWNLKQSAPWNYDDGITAYSQEILHSERMHIKTSAFSKIIQSNGIWNFGSRTINGFVVNPVYHANGVLKNKFWYLIPKRF